MGGGSSSISHYDASNDDDVTASHLTHNNTTNIEGSFDIWCKGNGFDDIKMEGVCDFESLQIVTEDTATLHELLAIAFPSSPVLQRRFIREIETLKSNGFSISDEDYTRLTENAMLREGGEVDIILFDFFRERKIGTDLLLVLSRDGVFDLQDMAGICKASGFTSWGDYFESKEGGRKLNLVERTTLAKAFL